MHPAAADQLELQVNPSVWAEDPPDNERLLRLEWLVTNGLGGYSSGTVAGVNTRRYHGLLTAALPSPLGRVVMLNHLHEEIWLPSGRTVLLTGEETPKGVSQRLCRHLKSFFLRNGLPVWWYEIDGILLEKQVWFTYQTNTVRVAYRALSAQDPVKLSVRPAFAIRPHEIAVSEPLDAPYPLTVLGDRIEIHAPGMPPLRLQIEGRGRRLVLDGGQSRTVYYRVEAARGYESSGPLWSPGVLEADLASGDSIHFLATTDEWDAALALTAEQSLAAELERRSHLSEHFTADDEVARHLTLAADQFIVAAVSRAADVAQAHAAGDQPRTVIAGYHWFTDWGRDTMISLEGLTLATGRWEEARHILRTFSRHVRDGLIPNLFPEGEREGVYHTADATLWFFHALDRYTAWTNDRETVRALLPTIGEIIAHHLRGTRFGIGVDPDDGLLQQGAEGYQLTWMDAKVGDWVVTPRRGKAVEINALWYNALRVYSKWLAELAEDRSQAEQIDRHAELARNSFNHRFWDEARQCLYDVVDGPAGNDASLRPNQLFAIALPHPILDRARWEGVMKICMETLLTPMGLRSLAPGEPNYVPVYDGDLRARDAAYHQGTVWGWLVGPLVDSWLKTHPDDRNTVRAFLEGFVANLHEACIGTMNEIFDAEAPYTPRGCVAQAWTVAEVLRCWQKTSPAKETA